MSDDDSKDYDTMSMGEEGGASDIDLSVARIKMKRETSNFC